MLIASRSAGQQLCSGVADWLHPARPWRCLCCGMCCVACCAASRSIVRVHRLPASCRPHTPDQPLGAVALKAEPVLGAGV